MIAHQDVAGVIAADLVERLRNWDHGIPKTMIVSEAADFIESQAQALSVAEAERDAWRDRYQFMSSCEKEVQVRALAAESRLAEARRVIVSLRDWLILAGDMTCREVPLGIARDFLNAKEKTNAQ